MNYKSFFEISCIVEGAALAIFLGYEMYAVPAVILAKWGLFATALAFKAILKNVQDNS